MTDFAVVGGWSCTHLSDLTADLSALDSEGFWVVVMPFDGNPVCVRFDEVHRTSLPNVGSLANMGGHPAPWSAVPGSDAPWSGTTWAGVPISSWRSSLDEDAFIAGVERIRSEISLGNVYQVNLTRRLRARTDATDISGLAGILNSANPAPFAALVSLPSHGIQIASASPELFVARDGSRIRSSPIKGTAAHSDGFLEKDRAENIMIVDLVRNDLGRICSFGSVEVTELLATEAHPGLFHLVSTVEGSLRNGQGWPEIVHATFPPGSVTGAPKLAAVELIGELETEDRGYYCGAIGWVDAEHRRGELNVAIRTFWLADGELNFGTGGAITYDSSAVGEWQETELKADRLLRAAARTGALE